MQTVSPQEMQFIVDMAKAKGITVADAGQPVTKPTDIYRVEMPNGLGPYNSGLPNAMQIYDMLAECGCVQPAIENNERMGITEYPFRQAHGHAAYACDSMASLRYWFPCKARKYLARYGAKIVEYELPQGAPLATIGNGEVIFNKQVAKPVATLPITEGC